MADEEKKVVDAATTKKPEVAAKPADDAAKQAAADEAAKKAAAEKAAAELAKAEAEPRPELSGDEEKQLEKLLDGQDEDDEDGGADAPGDFVATREKIRKLMEVINPNSPDSHTVWGTGGIILTLGDIRTLAKYMQ